MIVSRSCLLPLPMMVGSPNPLKTSVTESLILETLFNVLIGNL